MLHTLLPFVGFCFFLTGDIAAGAPVAWRGRAPPPHTNTKGGNMNWPWWEIDPDNPTVHMDPQPIYLNERIRKMAKKNTKVSKAIKALVNTQIKALQAMPKHQGQRVQLEKAVEICNMIANGSTFDEISAIFKDTAESVGRIPGSFSGGGAWFSRDLQIQAGRVLIPQISIVKTSTGKGLKTYADIATFEMAGGDASDLPRYVGSIVRCWTCGERYAVKELAHQLHCPQCESQHKRAKGNTGGVALSKLNDEKQALHAAATSAFINKDGELAQAFIDHLNAKRQACGLDAIDMDTYKAAENSNVLMK